MIRTINKLKLDQITQAIPPLPNGWLNGFDAAVLYTIARSLDHSDSILEVGSWIGRSSCVIAHALESVSDRKIRFDIVDFGIAGSREWEWRFGSSVYKEKDADSHLSVIMKAGGSGAVLKQNLIERDLARFVSLIVLGDIRDYESTRKYDFIFCDATHSPDEIRRNIPVISSRLSSEFILACDDIVNADDAEIIKSIVGADFFYLTNSSDQYSKLGVFIKGLRFSGLLT
jgi:hypothetical protein